MNEWEQKVWGTTRCTDHNKYWSRHELNTKAGGFCSVHYHLARKNIFHVLSGRLKVVWAYAWRINAIELGPGEHLSLLSGTPHQFQSIEPSHVIEEYAPDRSDVKEISLNDIERLTVGGVLPDGKIFQLWDGFFDQSGAPICSKMSH